MRNNKGQFMVGNIPDPNRRIYLGAEHANWKGTRVGYRALHLWIAYWKGKPKQCVQCGKRSGRLEWASTTREYARNLDEYISLCKSCHTKLDNKLCKRKRKL